MKKLIVLIITAVCLLSSFAPCDASPAIDDAARHCVSHCSLQCCGITLPKSTAINMPSPAILNTLNFRILPYQNPSLDGIEYPPNF